MPLVSVIIPTRDRSHLLREAIESVLASQSDAFGIEVIVVDDGSTDQTPEIVRSYPVTYVRGEGKGASAARNMGLQCVTGDYVTFLDDDDKWPENNLRTQINFLEANPQFGAVFSRVLLTDDSFTPIAGPYPVQPFRSETMITDFLWHVPSACAMVVRRSILTVVGGFDTSLQGGEDWDWVLRVAQHCQIGYIDQVILLWRIHRRPRVDGVGNRRPEDVSWRRFVDAMHVAHRYVTSDAVNNWWLRQRLFLKHKGHYVPIFLSLSAQYFRERQLVPSLRCLLLAVGISPLHVGSHLFRLLKLTW
jgi:glycosyltransferase involved in cell wall biosynthesis